MNTPRLLLAQLVLGGLFIGCGDDAGPRFGHLTFPGGVTLDIPEGAVAESVRLVATGYAQADLLPQEMRTTPLPILGAVRMQPDGLVFSQPVTLTFPLAAPAAAGSAITVLTWSPADGRWSDDGVVGEVTADGLAVEVLINCLSSRGATSTPVFQPSDPDNWPLLFEEWQGHAAELLGPAEGFEGPCCMARHCLRSEVRYFDGRGAEFDDLAEIGCLEGWADDATTEVIARRAGGAGQPYWWLSTTALRHLAPAHLALEPSSAMLCGDEMKRKVSFTAPLTCGAAGVGPLGQVVSLDLVGAGSVSADLAPTGGRFTYEGPALVAGDEVVTITATYDACGAEPLDASARVDLRVSCGAP